MLLVVELIAINYSTTLEFFSFLFPSSFLTLSKGYATREWLGYFEHMLCEAKEQGIVPATLDTATTAQALLAYFEGVMLLAKGRNDPSLIFTLRTGVLSLMQYQGERREHSR